MFTLRGMAWARAKAELQGILYTFWGEREDLDHLTEIFCEFIRTVEEESPLT